MEGCVVYVGDCSGLPIDVRCEHNPCIFSRFQAAARPAQRVRLVSIAVDAPAPAQGRVIRAPMPALDNTTQVPPPVV